MPTASLLKISHLTLTSPTGADPRFSAREYDPITDDDAYGYGGRYRHLDISVPGAGATGEPETFVLRYEARGALEQSPDGLRLSLPEPVHGLRRDAVTATISAPGGVRSIGCRWFLDDPCRHAVVVGGVGRLDNAGSTRVVAYDEYGQFHGLTSMIFTAGVTPGAVRATGPILEEPPDVVENGNLLVALFFVALFVLAVLVVALIVALLLRWYLLRRQRPELRA